MALLTRSIPSRQDWRMALFVTRREVRDAFRDWRIIIPIFLLTLGFPALMNFAARMTVNFVSNYGAEIIATQLIPFLMLVVGFFPMSFSLVIALETFVGEKERKSLEPLLATPLTDTQLYLGKMLAALIPPLLASYFGMFVYMIGLYATMRWTPGWQLFAQIMALTTVQGVIMVTGAVVASSQTTSVRAANLLASFIIVPMALLIQFEAMAMFWGSEEGLWWVVIGLSLTAVILMRMGIHTFNREELLGRDLDQLRLGWVAKIFWERFTGKDEHGRYHGPLLWYRDTLAIIPRLSKPILTLIVVLIGAGVLGVVLANMYEFPAHLQADIRESTSISMLTQLEGVLRGLPFLIIFHNVRVILLMMLLGVFTFGVLAMIIFALPWALVAFAVSQFALAGQDPWTFLLATIVPHAIVELPALLLITGAMLRWQIMVIAPRTEGALSESYMRGAGEFGRIFLGLGIPLLILAAFMEAFVTPQVLLWVYG